jgi:hypothetical protein
MNHELLKMNTVTLQQEFKFQELIQHVTTMVSLDEFFKYIQFDANFFFGNNFWTELNKLNSDVFFHINDVIIDAIGYKKTETSSSGQYNHRTNLFQCIKTNFIEKEDYILLTKSEFEKRDVNNYRVIDTLEKSKVKQRGGLKNELFMKRDSFKELLMIVRTQHSRLIYKYLIQYENHVEQYKQYQYEYEMVSLQKENNQLQLKSDEPRPLNIFQQNMLANLLKEEELYIITSKKYAEQYLFKIGRSCNSKSRCQQMNTSRVLDDETFYICHISKTYDVDNCEKHLHSLLESVRYKQDREFFMSPFYLLRDLMDTVTSSYGMHDLKLDDIICQLNSVVLPSINTDIPEPIFVPSTKLKRIPVELTEQGRIECIQDIISHYYYDDGVIYWIDLKHHIELKLNQKLKYLDTWKYTLKGLPEIHSRIKWTKHVNLKQIMI